MEIEDTVPVTSKKKHDKTDSSSDGSPSKHEGKKTDKKFDAESDPKPRIVLTFRSEKPGAKSSAMKIVSTEEKQEETSLRRSSRTKAKRDEDYDTEFQSHRKDKTSQQMSENDDVSDSSHASPPKRSTRRRSKEFDNVIANAIARKEKSYNETPAPSRPSRRIKPTAKVLANEELRMGLESQNNARLGRDADKSPEEGVRTRRSNRSGRPSDHDEHAVTEKKNSRSKPMEVDGEENQSQVMKLKHLCELGLKAIDSEDRDDTKDEEVADESIELEEEEDEEIDDDTEVISKLLEADAKSVEETSEVDSFDDTSDEDYETGRPRRSTSAPRRRSSRRPLSNYEETVHVPENAEDNLEAAVPPEESTIIAKCFCETPSNVHAAVDELTEPVFCQAIELVDGVRVGCSHAAAKEDDGSYSPLIRAGPRAPYFLACALHFAQLRTHMCCSACGLFCTQGIFYQCSESHLFHLECGLPYNDAKLKPGCPHCGMHSYRWQPVNRNCSKVQVQMKCSNKRIFLPDQREQCTPAYLGFAILDPSKLDQSPVIPAELLPSPPIDLKRLCEKPMEEEDLQDAEDSTPIERLCDAILAGEGVEKLIPKIMSGTNVNTPLPPLGGTVTHLAARRGQLKALYLLHYAGADLSAADNSAKTPLMVAILALLEKSETKSLKKSKLSSDREDDIEDESKDEPEEESPKKTEKKEDDDAVNGEDLFKVIRYLVAAGCDVNVAGPEGMTALHMAAQHGSTAVCSILLSSAGCNVDARDAGGWTPLVWAAENSHSDVVRLLLLNGADAMATDNEGNAVVHWCALAGCAPALQQLLDAEPDAVRALNKHTDTPLHVAARQGHYSCVVILLARGARTDVENSAGELPVEVCTEQCQSAISLNMQMALRANGGRGRQRLLCSDISRGREPHPLPCVNEVDDTPLPDDFTYITAHVTPQPIAIDCTTQSLQGCSCTSGDCTSGNCECVVLGVRRWWVRDRLKPGFPYHDPPMLFDCNQTCGCDARKCKNTIISPLCVRGSLFIRAQVFRCGGARGWGLRAMAAAPRGTPVATYCGELLSMADADSRTMDQYMFALDVKPDLLEQCSEKTLLCVDAGRWGGAARFINHSCRPNLAPVRVFTNTRDLRLPTVTLFAARDIRIGDELTFDYGEKFWSVKSKWMKCECGTPDCRYTEQQTES